MNIVSKLTLRHLGANKKRTVVTTFGIVASTEEATSEASALSVLLR